MEELEIIEHALNVASKRGAFTLEESTQIYNQLNKLKDRVNTPKPKTKGK